MVSILDYSKEDDGKRGVSIGKIEDTGSFSTKDKLLESILNEYVENGVKTYIPEHSKIGIRYNVGVVECGQKGFAKAVIQHLPSPYYGKHEEIKQLPDYEVKDVQTDKNDSPIRGKQGMNSINRFTSLASESPPVTRERVDAEWNEVENEEDLPESSKNKSNFTVNTIELQNVPSEYREYLDDGEQPPEGVQTYEGDRDGTYYDTRDVEDGEGETSEKPEIEELETSLWDDVDKWNKVFESYTTKELKKYYESKDYGSDKVMVKNLLYYKDDSDIDLHDCIEIEEVDPYSDADIETIENATEACLNSFTPAGGAKLMRSIGSIEAGKSRHKGVTEDRKYITIDDNWGDTVVHEIGHVLQYSMGIQGGQRENDPHGDPDNWIFSLKKTRGTRYTQDNHAEEILEDMEKFWNKAVENKKKDLEELGEVEEEFTQNEISTYQWEDASEFFCETFAAWIYNQTDLQMVYPELAEYYNEKFNDGELPMDPYKENTTWFQ